MPTSNASIGSDGDPDKPTGPGHLTGEGSESVLPYLHDSQATRPGELLAQGQSSERKPARRSLASRVRRALLDLKQSKKGQSGSR